MSPSSPSLLTHQTATTMTAQDDLLRVSIDRGGTFCDCIGSRKGQDDIVIKVSTPRLAAS